MSDAEQHFQAQKEAQDEQQRRDMAFNQAAQAGGVDQAATTQNPSFMREYSDPDISPRPGATEFEKRVAPELSQHQLFGNISRAEFEARKPLNDLLAMQMKAEFPRRSGPSSKCTGEYRRILTGTPEHQHPPVLTPDMARRIMSAVGEEGVKLEQLSGAIDGTTKEALTQIQSSVYTDTGGQGGGGGSSGGIAQSAKNLLGFS